MFKHVEQTLESLSAALGGLEAAPTEELREVLGLAKSLRTKVELLETRAASVVAQRERHGDGGAGLLNQVGGLSRSEAARNVRVASELASLPEAQSAVADGEISLANAAKLAQAARKTSPEAVQDDVGLVEMAKALPTDEFAQAAQRWTIQRQSAAALEEQHRRNRRNRSVRFWNGEDGTVQMRGAFDTEMGARIQARLRGMAEQLRRADRRRLRDGAPQDAVRTRDQRMADALDRLLVGGSAVTEAPMANAGAPTIADAGDEAPGRNPVTMYDADGRPAIADAGDGAPGGGSLLSPETAAAAPTSTPGFDGQRNQVSADRPTGAGDTAGQAAACSCPSHRPTGTGDPTEVELRRPVTEVIVRADLDALLGRPGGTAEIPGAGPIPPSALDRLLCGSDLSLVLCGADFTPLFEAVASRAPTAAQRRALIARDGACIGCGEPPGECEAHHIVPWKKGGKTRVDNLVLVCWSCHDRIHDHNWRVVVRGGRFRLVPPDPAHPHNPARSRKPARKKPARRSNGTQVGHGRQVRRGHDADEGDASRTSPEHDPGGPIRGAEHNVDRPGDDWSSPGHEPQDLFAVA